jgi:hypothetical protein
MAPVFPDGTFPESSVADGRRRRSFPRGVVPIFEPLVATFADRGRFPSVWIPNYERLRRLGDCFEPQRHEGHEDGIGIPRPIPRPSCLRAFVVFQ